MGRTLYATTHAPGINVRIYVNPALKQHWATAGASTVDIAPALLKKSKAFRAGVLLHEFVHIVENHSEHEELTPVIVGDCTALARTLERRLTPLILNLKVRGERNPFLPSGLESPP